MASSIDAANPVSGNPTTLSVRANFTAAKSEIEALQAGTSIATATATSQGVVELATIAETNTGTDAARAVTPDALDGWTGSVQLTTTGVLASLVATTADINGGTVDAVIGGTTPAAGTFTTFTSTGIDDNATSAAITIDTSENVGIGTTSPATALDVEGGIIRSRSSGASNASPAGGAGLEFNADASPGIDTITAYDRGGAAWRELRFYSSPMSFWTEGLERMRIDSAGKVGIGTTAPAGKFQVKGSAASTSLGWITCDTTGDLAIAALRISKFDNNSTTSQIFQRFSVNQTTASGSITANGASQAAFGTWSDARLKENITDLPNQLDNILALRPVEFDYKDGSGHQTGFIAQEMQEVYPCCVGEDTESGMLTVGGWNKTEARLVSAIQEQQTLIDALTARLEVLEGS